MMRTLRDPRHILSVECVTVQVRCMKESGGGVKAVVDDGGGGGDGDEDDDDAVVSPQVYLEGRRIVMAGYA